MSSDLVERLLAATGDDRLDAGVAVEAVYHPAGDGKVMPPSYPNGPYLIEPRWVDGAQREVVILDQVPSQANRVEEALLAARDAGRIRLPLFEMRANTSRGELRLTSLEFPHRYADAYLRDSEIDGVRFDESPIGRRLREATVTDIRPLLERDPGSLLYGAWDSYRKGRWPKFARAYISSIVGLDPLLGQRRGGRLDPLNLTGNVDDAGKAEGAWAFVADGEKTKGQQLSKIGHGNIPPNPVHGGVSITQARRSAWISLAALERLRFGDATPQASHLARATLAALALAGDRLAFGGPSIWLRSGCDLVLTAETLAFERPGGEQETVTLTADDAIAAFHELQKQAAAAGLRMATDTIVVKPIRSLAQAIEHTLTQAADED